MHDVSIKTLTSCDSQQDVFGRKINSTAPERGLCVKVRTSPRSRDPDGELGANGATSAEKVHRVTEEFECTGMSVRVVRRCCG